MMQEHMLVLMPVSTAYAYSWITWKLMFDSAYVCETRWGKEKDVHRATDAVEKARQRSELIQRKSLSNGPALKRLYLISVTDAI